MTVAGGAGPAVQRAVEIADVTVDRTNTEAGGAHGVGNGVDGIAVEHVGNVVADSGQAPRSTSANPSAAIQASAGSRERCRKLIVEQPRRL